MTNFKTNYYIIGVLMMGAYAVSLILQPTSSIAENETPIMKEIIPKQFSAWREIETGMVQAGLTPREGEDQLDLPYDQTLMRSYQRDDGAVIMLALAYGREQRQERKVHRPELCYIAQGFRLMNKRAAVYNYQDLSVPVVQLLAGNGRRIEPITYWIRIGDKIVQNAFETRLSIFYEGLLGRIPDGILMRVSAVIPPSANLHDEYAIHKDFLNDLLNSMDREDREVLIGPNA